MKKIGYFVCMVFLSGFAYAETETIEVGADVAVSKCQINKGGDNQLCLEVVVVPTPIQITLTKYPGSGVAPEIWLGSWQKEIEEEGIYFTASVEIVKYQYTDPVSMPYYRITLTLVSDAAKSSEPGPQTRVSFSAHSLDELITLDIEGDTVFTDCFSLVPHFVFGRPLSLRPDPLPDK